MGSRKQARVSAEPEPTVSQRLEQQELLRLSRAAQAKIQAKQPLTRAERTALARFEQQQTRTHGVRYVRAMPKGDFLDLFGGSSKVYIEWRTRYGFPWPESAGTVDVLEVGRWYRRQFVDGGQKVPTTASEDDILLSGASQELKDEFIRERIKEKRITNQQKAIELEIERRSYVPLAPIIEAHNELAERIRKTRESLARQFDGQARERVELAFDDMIADYVQDLETHFGDGSPDENEDAA